jgi:Response regulators consisting of a CheY-like receiver domain and a winged-helix DNA-binding domain
MSAASVEGLDEQTVIVCVSANLRDRARVARLMSGCGTLLIFSDMESARRMLFDAREPNPEPERPSREAIPRGLTVMARGRLVIDLDRQRVTWAGRTLPLTRTERELVATLARPPLRVWTYRELYECVWGSTYLDDLSAIRSTVKRLRAKLRAAGAGITLQSSRGVGFYLAETAPDDGEPEPASPGDESPEPAPPEPGSPGPDSPRADSPGTAEGGPRNGGAAAYGHRQA